MIPIALSLLAALAVAVAAWRDRSIGASLVLFALPSYLVRFSIGGVPLTMLELMILSLFLVFVVRDWKKIICYRPNWWQLLLVALFLLAGGFSLAVSPSLTAGLGIFKAYMVEPLLFCLVISIALDSRRQLNRLFVALALSAALVGALAVLQYFLGWGIPEPWNLWDGNRRATVFYGYPNAVGLFIAPVLAATISACLIGKKHRRLLLGAAVAMFLGLLAARVEGAIIAVLAATTVTLFFTKARWWALGVSGAGLTAGFFIEPLRRLMLFQDTSGDVRLALWRGTWNLLQENPVFGAGLAGFPVTYDTYRLPSHVELLLYPHNIILNFWVELGFIGLVWIIFAVLLVAVLALSSLKRSRVYSISILAVLTAVLVYGIVDVPYFKNDLSVLFWALLGAALILNKKKKRSTS